MQRILRKLYNVLRRIKVMSNWYRFCWPLTHIGSWPRTAVLRSGARIAIRGFRSGDFAIFNELVIDDVYRIASFQEPKRVIDLGANIGVFSILVAKKFPNATVFALEPEQKNFEILKRNVEASNAKNIVLVNKAVAAQSGTALLNISGHNSGAHSLFRNVSDGKGETQTVSTVTLNEFLPADIIKVDAEGAEYEIFEKEIPDCKLIVMEMHNGDRARLLERFGSKYDISVYDLSYGQIHILKHK